MHISARTEYACIAVLELASSYDTGEPVQLRRIAAAHGIPSRFLVQILLQLKNAGIVQDEKRGTQVYYNLRCPCVLDFVACVNTVLKSNVERQLELVKNERMGG